MNTTYNVTSATRGTLAANVSLAEAVRVHRADHAALDQDRRQLTRTYSDAKIERADGEWLTDAEHTAMRDLRGRGND